MPIRGAALLSSNWVRKNIAAAVTAVVIVSGLLAIPAASPLGRAGGAPISHSVAAPTPATAPSPLAVRPSIGPGINVTGHFFQNTSGFSTPPSSQQYCTSPTFGTCYPQSQDPTIVRMTNGQLGAGFSAVTTRTTNTCTGAAANTGMRIGWDVSKDNGTSFGAVTQIGNTTCSYEQAIEPSFAAGPRGHVYGAFVESNASQYQILGYYGTPVLSYTTRYDDALAFISISSNGTKFAKPVTVISGGNISRPQIATYGDSVYIVYENISNGTNTSTIPGSYYPPAEPISVQLVYSADNGTTWHGPYGLPGLNSTEYYTSVSPSIAVSGNGTVAVAYATNRSCLALCGYIYGAVYGDAIVVSTSLTNGTTWKGPHVVHGGAGEYYYYQGSYMSALFEASPETAIAWNGLAGAWEVAWAGGLNISLTSSYVYSDWYDFQVSSGSSLNNGVTWSTAVASPRIPEVAASAGTVEYYNPGINVENGIITLTYTELNNSGSGSGCGPISSSGYLGNSLALWTQNGTDGVNWSSSLIVEVTKSQYGGYMSVYDDYQGHLGSVAYTSNGTVLLGYTLAQSYYYDSVKRESMYPTKLVVAQPSLATTTSLTVQQNGIAAGVNWGFALNGNVFESTQRNITVTNVPTTTAVVLVPEASLIPSAGYWRQYLPTLSGSPAGVFKTPSSFYINFSLWDGIAFYPQPLSLISEYGNTIYLYDQGVYSYNANWENYLYCYTATSCYQYAYYYGCPFPWYIPDGTSLELKPGVASGTTFYSVYSFQVPVSYWSGTGAGNFTGGGSWANITMNAGINQSMWMLPYGSYSEYFTAPTLPASSTFSLTFDGQNLSGPGTSVVHANNVTTGAYWVTNAQATSSEPGWKYFGGPSSGNPVLVPDQTMVNLSFAAVNLSAPVGTISFHANGLTAGTIWQFAFNGTTLSSNTPWINVTGRPGIYPTSAFVVTSANGSAGYTPIGVPGVWNVTTGTTYEVNYTSAYRLDLVVGQGGSVSPSTSSYWVAPGTTKTFTATPAIGFAFGGWVGQGVGSFTGNSLTASVTANGPVVEVAAFFPLAPNRFNMTFAENGIPNGTTWTLLLNGIGYSSSNSSLTIPNVYSCVFSQSRGRYALNVPFAYANNTPAQTRYVAKAYPSTLCGGSPLETLNFTAQYFLTMEWTSGGNVSVAYGSTVAGNSVWVPGLTGVTIQATPAPGYIFLGWNGSGAAGNFTGISPIGSVAMEGPITEIAAFGIVYVPPAPRYWASFHLNTPLPPGQTWDVTFNGANYSSSTAFLNITNLLAGSYSVAVPTVQSTDGLTQYAAVGVTPRIGITANASVQVTYSTSYWVSVSEVGGGSVGPASGWFPAGASVGLTATPSGTNVFSGWQGTGPGAYSGTNATPAGVRANGPLTEVATFVPPVPPAVQVTSSFNSVPAWAGFALIGLVVGLVVGLIAMRARARRGPPTAYAAEPVEGAPPGTTASEPAPSQEVET
jgi:Divergent InlB B-repeat domain